ncbi:Rho/RAC guanine nucleotide exchange factor [Entamoeba marina]
MFGVSVNHLVSQYYEAWVESNTRNETEVVRFEVNENFYEMEKTVLENERSLNTTMKYLVQKKEKEINSNQVIRIPGGSAEEKIWFVYFDYLSGEGLYNKELSVRQTVERVIALMYFGVALPDGLMWLGVTKETLALAMSKLLMVMDRKFCECLKKLDEPKEYLAYIKKGVLNLVNDDLYGYQSNETNIRVICSHYNLTDQLNKAVETKEKEVKEQKLKAAQSKTNKVFASLRVRKDVVQPIIDEEKIRRMRERLKNKNVKISKINIDGVEDMPTLIFCQDHIRRTVVLSKYKFKSIRDRRNDFVEFVDTEKNLVTAMKKLDKLYRKPMLEAANASIFVEKDIHRIFTTLEKCIINSEKIEQRLRPLVDGFKYDTCVGNDILSVADLITPYLPYTTDYNISEKLFKAIKDIPAMQDIIKKANAAQGSSPADFATLLIQPVQRTMRYPLLLDTLKKHTMKMHPDYEQIVAAEQKYKFFSTTINQRAKMRDGLMSLAETLGNDDIIVNGRYYVTQTEVEENREKMIAVLFNDGIMMIKEKLYTAAKNAKTHSKVKISSIFKFSSKTTISVTNNFLSVYTGNDSLFLMFETTEVCKQWSEEITGIIEDKFWDLDSDLAWLTQYEKR